jgi:hypothetical protein
LAESGAEIAFEEEKLRIKVPKGAVTASVLNQVDQFKPELVELLEREVAWRVEKMRTQIKPLGPIPLFMVKENSEKGGVCVSCGNSLPVKTRFRCWFCGLAARKVVSDLR